MLSIGHNFRKYILYKRCKEERLEINKETLLLENRLQDISVGQACLLKCKLCAGGYGKAIESAIRWSDVVVDKKGRI